MIARKRRMVLLLRSTEADTMETTLDPASLQYIDEKQGPTRGLAHMSDSVFAFFMHLYLKVAKIHTHEGMHVFFHHC